jgi:Ni/Co efflux regulator RcnB
MYRLTSVLALSLFLLHVVAAYPVADASAQQQSSNQYKGAHRNTRHATSAHHQAHPRDNDKATYRSELLRAKSEWRHVQHSGTK